MDLDDLHEEAESLFAELRGRVRESDRTGMISLLTHGEEEEAIDLLVAALVNERVLLSGAEGGSVRRIVGYFDLPPHAATDLRYLAVPEMLDRLNVVDTDGTPP